MFGYILPEKPELKIREFEIYKAYYCGVCKAIGKRHGNIPRLTLTYDTTFLALLLSSISDESFKITREGCIAHPLKKRKIIKDSEIIDYAADMNIILSYLNLKDKWVDDKSVLSLAGLSALSNSYKKLVKQYPQKCVIIIDRLKELAVLEDKKCDSIDQAAEPFAKLMEEVMLYKPICESENNEKILRWIGYNLGKWIYTTDAFDDLEDDINKKAYNPLIYQYKYMDESIQDFRIRIKENVEFNLIYTLNQVSKGFELLECKRNAGIVENIIYLGMLRKTEKILGTGGNTI
ncbi:MAG: hypothetical protein IMZ47_08815 [Firmicutes bacterium]|nr:hypothetical protein [Bacillota bacterium]